MIKDCEKCRLRKTCTQIVNGCGGTKSKIMLIGEAPGEDEDKVGKPFVGQSGKMLNSVLLLLGVIRKNVYITNVIKCRPPKNRDPLGDEVSTCLPYLKKEIDEVDPSLVILLGKVASNSLGINGSMAFLNGLTVNSPLLGRKVAICYHPSAILHNQMLRVNLESCMMLLSETVLSYYKSDVKNGQASINDLYRVSKSETVKLLNTVPGDFITFDDGVTSYLDALISYVFYQKYSSVTRLQEFHDYLTCGYIHGDDRSNFIGSVIRRLNQTIILYNAHVSKPESQNLIKALYNRGIKSKEGAEKLYKKVGLNVIR